MRTVLLSALATILGSAAAAQAPTDSGTAVRTRR